MIRFSDGNLFVRVKENVRGRRVYLVQSTVFPANDNFMELLFWIDALKRASAESVTAVIPYFSYAKGDKKDEPRVSIRARVCADAIEVAGADRVVMLDLHAPQIQGFFRIPVDDLYALPVLCEEIVRKQLPDLVVVSPDAGFVKQARKYASFLGTSIAIGDKQRKAHNERAEVLEIIGEVSARHKGGVRGGVARGLQRGLDGAARPGVRSRVCWSRIRSKLSRWRSLRRCRPSRWRHCSARRFAASTTGKASAACSRHEESYMKGISHVAIGVSDMDRALPFYRDTLGLEVMLDAEEKVGNGKRRAVYMRWKANSGFLVLSQTLGREASGKPLRLHQVGLHHFAFWVDDLRARVEKLQRAGVKILVPPCVPSAPRCCMNSPASRCSCARCARAHPRADAAMRRRRPSGARGRGPRPRSVPRQRELMFALQAEQRGTGHAARCGMTALPRDFAGDILITYGDLPMLSPATLTAFRAAHRAVASRLSFISANVADAGVLRPRDARCLTAR